MLITICFGQQLLLCRVGSLDHQKHPRAQNPEVHHRMRDGSPDKIQKEINYNPLAYFLDSRGLSWEREIRGRRENSAGPWSIHLCSRQPDLWSLSLMWNAQKFLFDFIHLFIHFNNIVNFNTSLILKFLNSALYC